MKAQLILSLFVIFMIGSADAKIYKWVDENGNVRYSDTPPEDHTIATDKVNIKDTTNSQTSLSSDADIEGAWWAMTQEGVRTLFLGGRGSFQIHRWSTRAKQLDTLFLGRWKQQGNSIELTYTHDFKKKDNKGREGQVETIKVVNLTATQASITWPSGTTLDYFRKNGKSENQSYQAEVLNAEWKLPSGLSLKFSAGEFEITPDRSARRLAMGNYTLSPDNETLSVEYVYDFRNVQRGEVGKTYQYEVLDINLDNMTLRDKATKLTTYLTRSK